MDIENLSDIEGTVSKRDIFCKEAAFKIKKLKKGVKYLKIAPIYKVAEKTVQQGRSTIINLQG